MSERPNLADPSFEPTDEDLIGLSVRAFAGVREAHAAVLEKLRRDIAEARREVMRTLEERRAARQAPR